MVSPLRAWRCGAQVVEWHAGERGEADGTGSVSSVQSPAAKLHVPETATG